MCAIDTIIHDVEPDMQCASCRVGLLAAVWGVKRALLIENDPIKIYNGVTIIRRAAAELQVDTSCIDYKHTDLTFVSCWLMCSKHADSP